MRKTLSILILILVLSCDKSENKTIDYGAFEITVPKSWSVYEIKGIDSYVSGLISNKNDTLIFDLGAYSPDLTRNPELLVFEETEYAELTAEQKEKLKGKKHLIVADFTSADYEPKNYLKYEFELDSIDCFQAKFIEPKIKGFGASGIYIDSLKGGGMNSNKIRLSFYGNDLTDSTQVEFFKALKNIKFNKKYCE